jgi:hypothetical protein
MGTGYATLWNAFKRITAGCSPSNLTPRASRLWVARCQQSWCQSAEHPFYFPVPWNRSRRAPQLWPRKAGRLFTFQRCVAYLRFSPQIQMLQQIRAKFGPMVGLPPAARRRQQRNGTRGEHPAAAGRCGLTRTGNPRAAPGCRGPTVSLPRSARFLALTATPPGPKAQNPESPSNTIAASNCAADIASYCKLVAFRCLVEVRWMTGFGASWSFLAAELNGCSVPKRLLAGERDRVPARFPRAVLRSSPNAAAAALAAVF